MANTTVSGALAIHGQNPQFLVETIIRNRIYDSTYWKEHCFALTAETLIDKAIETRYVGGVYSNQRPTQFICLVLKLLQIQPEKEILVEYLRADEFKYLRALAALYIRLTFRAVDVYELLEPLLKDYSKLRLRDVSGFHLTYMDEFVYNLLTEERESELEQEQKQKQEPQPGREQRQKPHTKQVTLRRWVPICFEKSVEVAVGLKIPFTQSQYLSR
ncbi:putative PRP38 family protein [Lyophyllum shimeji]|uniref:Pre-mRNA-splicing factor 38 n=1 Tax=Lyophyllum shimeji TaxID=47721 RepID=A0A9P3UIA6_LYOSH|nr:putative PRP38 family protein [Lyophyllum shimeji]